MNDDEITAILSIFEKAIPKQGAVAKFREFGEVALYANRDGYLRIAAEMLKCTLNRPQEADLNYKVSNDSDFSIDHLTTTEEQFEFISK